MWVNYLFFFTIIVYALFFILNMKLIRNVHYRVAISILILTSISINLYFLWYIFGKVHVYGLHPREVLMFWLAYPEYNIPFLIGILSMIYLLIPYKKFITRVKLALNINFLIGLSFEIKILINELPAHSTQEYINALYQAQHAALVGSIFLFFVIISYWSVYSFKRKKEYRNNNLTLKEVVKDKNEQNISVRR